MSFNVDNFPGKLNVYMLLNRRWDLLTGSEMYWARCVGFIDPFYKVITSRNRNGKVGFTTKLIGFYIFCWNLNIIRNFIRIALLQRVFLLKSICAIRFDRQLCVLDLASIHYTLQSLDLCYSVYSVVNFWSVL